MESLLVVVVVVVVVVVPGLLEGEIWLSLFDSPSIPLLATVMNDSLLLL